MKHETGKRTLGLTPYPSPSPVCLAQANLGSHSWSVMASRPGIARIDSQGAASRARFDMVSSRTAQHGAAKLAGSGRSTLYLRDYNSPPVPVMYTRRLAFYAQHRIPPLTLPLTSLYLICKRLKQPERSGRMETPEILISRTALAKQLGLTRDTLRRWARIGHGPTPVKLSKGCIRYRPSEVQSFLKSGEPVA